MVVVVGEVFGCKAVSFVQCPRFVYSPEVFHMEPENHLLEKGIPGIPNLETHPFSRFQPFNFLVCTRFSEG